MDINYTGGQQLLMFACRFWEECYIDLQYMILYIKDQNRNFSQNHLAYLFYMYSKKFWCVKVDFEIRPELSFNVLFRTLTLNVVLFWHSPAHRSHTGLTYYEKIGFEVFVKLQHQACWYVIYLTFLHRRNNIPGKATLSGLIMYTSILQSKCILIVQLRSDLECRDRL